MFGTTTQSEEIYQVFIQASGLAPGRLVRVIDGNGRLPEFLQGRAAPYGGVVPDEGVFNINLRQQLLDEAALEKAMQPQVDGPWPRQDEVMHRFGFTKDIQIEAAIAHFGFPKGTRRSKSLINSRGGGVEQDVWVDYDPAALDRYEAVLRIAYPRALPPKR